MTALRANGNTVPKDSKRRRDSDDLLIDVLVKKLIQKLPRHCPADIALWRLGLLRYAQQSLKVLNFHLNLLDWRGTDRRDADRCTSSNWR